MNRKGGNLLFIFFMISATFGVYGQDSLSARIELNRKRSADSLISAGFLTSARDFYSSGHTDSAIANINRSLGYATMLDFSKIEALDYELLGAIYDRLANWEEMLFYYLRANSFYVRLNDRESQASILKTVAGKYFELGIYDKSAMYYEQEFSVRPQTNTAEIPVAAESAARSWYFYPDDSLSLEWYNAALHFYQKNSNDSGVIRCREKLASLYTRKKAYAEATAIYNDLLESYNRNNDIKGAASVINNLGYLKFRQGDFEKALSNFNRAAGMYSTSAPDAVFLTDIYTNIAVCYQNLGKKSETLINFNKALGYSTESNSLKEKANLEHFLALIYFKQKDYYHADLYCQDCIESATRSSSPEIMQECYKTWSSVMESGNDFVKALLFYEKYLGIRDSLAFEQRLSEKNEKDRRESYNVTEQKVKLDIANQEIQGLALRNLTAESQRKENELKLLLKQKELDRSEKERLSQTLVLEKEHSSLLMREQEVRSLEQQKINDSLLLKVKADSAFALMQSNKILENEKNQQELKAEKQKQYKRMAVGIVILLFLVTASILAGLLNSRKKNLKLAESKREVEKINADLELKNTEIIQSNAKISQQKDIIEQKNQAITDSIQYASRIQTAVLPPDDFISEMGLENFILYKPKDIISGDFYWGMEQEGKIYLAAADCTGHGVPGALMSMLGHVFLDEILHTSTPVDAADVLNRLRDEVINTLKQKGVVGEARDGMDISLCILDREKSYLDYAGANNSLYLVRDEKLIKIQADRMPIGIHVTTIAPFTNQKIEIKNGDRLYIFSDGFADQFGGPRGRKFMYKPFQDLILRNSSKTMALQKEILDNTFIKWMGERSQVDDVLVLGIML